MSKEILSQHIQNGGSCTNLGRTLKASHQELHDWIIESTPWIPADAKFNERVYCILNDIPTQVNDLFNKPARFINLFRGYSLLEELYEKTQRGDELRAQKELARSNRPAPQTKLDQFLTRNAKSNAHLYDADSVEGYDYVVCPVTNARVVMIKLTYIENYLGLTVEEFDAAYPSTQKIAGKRVDNIKHGLKQIDEETGLTKHQLSTVKAKETLGEVDDTGLSGYQKKGQKTRETHMNNVDEFGRNGYSQLASKAIVVGNATKASRGLILPPDMRLEFYRYKIIVTYLTERQRKSLSAGYVTGLAGEDDAWHIDHIMSIMDGYNNGISPLVIGHSANLRMIPWEENLSKHASSDITADALFEKAGYTPEQSQEEFIFCMERIQQNMKEGAPSSGARILDELYETELSRKHRV